MELRDWSWGDPDRHDQQMGLGDYLLAAGQAKLLHRRTGRKVSVGNGKKVDWFPLYERIPYLSREPAEWLVDYQGHRQYIAQLDDERYTWNLEYKAEPAELEIKWKHGDYIVIEPNIKDGAPPGKQWHGFQEVVNRLDVPFVQPSYGQPLLRGVSPAKTMIQDIPELIANARCCLLPDGFLHHVAAATETPSVVIWGGFAPPEVLGYEFHENVSYGPALGHRKATKEVMEAMKNITVDQVIERLERLL